MLDKDYWHHARQDLYRMIALLLSAVLVVALFWLTQPINHHQHQQLMTQFAQLHHSETRLGELALQLNFNLSNNYDDINHAMTSLYNSVERLKHDEISKDVRAYPSFVQQLTRFEQELSQKQKALEQFKSRNAVLKNSLIYLPKARDDLIPLLKQDPSVIDDINRLVEQLLLERVSNAFIEQNQVDTIAQNLLEETEDLSNDNQKRIRIFIRHARLVESTSKEINQLIGELLSSDDIHPLTASYHDYYQHRQALASFYRWFLLIAALLLSIFAIKTVLKLQQSAQQLKLASSVFNHASEGIIITNEDGVMISVNPAFSQITGFSREEAIGKKPKILSSGRHGQDFYRAMWESIKQTGSWQGEIWNRHKDGTIYPEALSINSVQKVDGSGISHFIATFKDVTSRKQSEEEIYQLAFYDPLTKLPNRRLLLERLQHKLTLNDGTNYAALFFIDLDNFKILNDTKGHAIGDLMLIEAAKRLSHCISERDTLARLGGDEFVILLEDAGEDTEQAILHSKHVAENILLAINTSFNLQNLDYSGSCSIGIRLFHNQVSIEELFKQADTAMYAAKQAGRNRFMFFDPVMQNQLEAYSSLEADIQQALQLGQFELFYQVQVDSNGMATGAEVLLRWRHPERGLVFPDQFIPLLEETGLIIPVGLWVLRTACQQLNRWQQQTRNNPLILAVNVSARQFAEPSFIADIEAILQETNIRPSRLKLEITESMLLQHIESIIRTMHQLKGLGIRFSMDDFGTGYSSLQYLKRLPLDQLKIDQSFVRDIGIDNNDDAIVSTIIAMAHSLGLSVIAEGVETEMQRNLLFSQGCHHYQGYLFSKPVPLAEFEALLEQIGNH